MVDKQDLTSNAYTLGILSIVLAFFQPLAGLIIGIVGVSFCKKQTSPLAKKARKLNTIGIVLGTIIFIVSIILAIVFTIKGFGLPLA